ncbi:MAG: hypothetical protein BGP14_21235 [Sphingobacteriales bacterium 44-15]|nr:MAG: hypothetical protein BGP14_21235 [Sphingobacteriales bacterium 44-15]
MKKQINILIHISCWLLYLMLPVIFSPGFGNRSTGFPHIMGYPLHMFIFNLALIPFYYFNAYFLVPRFFFNNKNWIYFLCIAGFLILLLAIPLPERRFLFVNGKQLPIPFADSIFINGRQIPGLPPGDRVFVNPPRFAGFRHIPRVFSFLLVWLLGTMIQVIHRWQIAEKKSKESELEKVNAELSFLKLQINPHFLFNTLNNIYALASIQSAQTPAAIMKLSDIMRYVMYDAQSDYVPLDKEIEYIRNYIELQKMRSNDKLALIFEANGNISGQKIAPLLLLSFIENAFKYGISNHEESKIEIIINVNRDTLHMVVNNAIFNRIQQSNNSIGLPNTRRRLELLYPNRHQLKVNKAETNFNVDLSIQL